MGTDNCAKRMKMKNVYDIRYEKNLTYILPCETKTFGGILPEGIYARTAIILYLYYEDRLSAYWSYIEGIPELVSIYIISSQGKVLEKIQKHMAALGRHNINYILKENRGRDVGALVVTGAEIVKKYEYVCFLHDKKEHSKEVKEDTDLWVDNLWGNLLSSPDYIMHILKLFEETEKLGALVPPEPIGDHFCTWYGNGWHHSWKVTKALADRLGLKTTITEEKPPITIGTALWFRTKAMKKLFDWNWRMDDFDDAGLNDKNYISYGIERIFAYVAQDAGYETGTVMTVEYARRQTCYLQYSLHRLFMESYPFFPILSICDLERYKENVQEMVRFARNNKRIYLYGIGDMGRFCFFVLRRENLLPEAYIISKKNKDDMVNGLPVYTIDGIENLMDAAIIITVFDEKSRREIVNKLLEKQFYNYMEFWR